MKNDELKHFFTRSYRKAKDVLLRQQVDKPIRKMHADLLSSLLPGHATDRTEKKYWEERGRTAVSDEDVLWRDPRFRTVEDKHVSYLLGICQNKDVLDVGAGWGRFGIKLRGSYRNYTGLEQSSSMIARGPKSLNLVQGSGDAMPFADASFDVIFMVICISSVYRKLFRIYDESIRCLRTNGVFAILEPNVTVIFEKPCTR